MRRRAALSTVRFYRTLGLAGILGLLGGGCPQSDSAGNGSGGVVAGDQTTNPNAGNAVDGLSIWDGATGGNAASSSDGSGTASPPGTYDDISMLQASASALDFGPAVASLSLLVWNAGIGDLGYQITSNAGWLSVNPAAGSSAGEYDVISVSVNRSGLAVGSHAGTLTLTDAQGVSFTVAVAMQVSDPYQSLPPLVGLSTNLIDLGTASYSADFAVFNGGTGTLSYTLSAVESWLSLSATSGQSQGEHDSFTITVNRDPLDTGNHLGRILVSGNGGQQATLWVLVTSGSTANGDPPSDAQILAWMQELAPLQKAHYSWPIPFPMIESGDERVFEFARLTKGLSLLGPGIKQVNMNAAVQIAKRAKALPGGECTLALFFSPYHDTLPDGTPPTYNGPEVQESLDNLSGFLANAGICLGVANGTYTTNVQIAAVVLDIELWHTKTSDQAGYQEWNDAMDAKYLACYNEVQAVFPGMRVEWYNRGGAFRCAQATGWCTASYFTLKEPGEHLSVSLYRLPDLGYTREGFARTRETALAKGMTSATPWIALGAGIPPEIDGGTWTFDWNFDLYYSWQIGQELNNPWFATDPERYAPWDFADIVIFYPEPFGRGPNFEQHFVAYVRGANMIAELPE